MKRLLALGAAIIGSGIVLALLATSLVSSDAARARIETELAGWLGVAVEVGEPARVDLWPFGLVLDGVRLESRQGGWRLEEASIRASLDPLALVIGRVSVSAFAVSGGHLRVAPHRIGGTPGEAAAAFAGKLHRFLRHPLTLSGVRLTIEDGRPDAARLVATDIALRLSSTGGDATLRGALMAADQRVEVTVSLADKAVLIGAGAGAVTVSLASPLAALRIDGAIADTDPDRLEGRFELSTSDLRGLMRRLGHDLVGDAVFGTARLSGTGTARAGVLALDAVKLDLDGNAGEGRLAIEAGDLRPRIEGTLAFETLDLSAYLQEFASAATPPAREAGWGTRPLAEALKALDLDLRLSAQRLVAGSLSAGPGAIAALLRDGDLAFDLSETMLGGGRAALAGRLRRDPATRTHVGTLTLVGDGVGLPALPWPEALVRPQAGTLTARADLAVSGDTVSELLAGYSAKVTATATGARFAAADPDAAFSRLRGIENGGQAAATAQFETIDLELDMAPGEVRVARLDVRTRRHALALRGRVEGSGWREAGLSLRGTLVPASVDGESATAGAVSEPGLRVLVRGTLAEPSVLPDLTGVGDPPLQ